MSIVFNNQYFNRKFKHISEAKKLINYIVAQENKKLGEISVIFTNNKNILAINRTYLNHNYYTDVITFCNNYKNAISGDIYISIEQVVLNARELGIPEKEEVFRVIIHGVLHLIGYTDNVVEEEERMREKEEIYLGRLANWKI